MRHLALIFLLALAGCLAPIEQCECPRAFIVMPLESFQDEPLPVVFGPTDATSGIESGNPTLEHEP